MEQLGFGSVGIPPPGDLECASSEVLGEVPHHELQEELKTEVPFTSHSVLFFPFFQLKILYKSKTTVTQDSHKCCRHSHSVIYPAVYM